MKKQAFCTLYTEVGEQLTADAASIPWSVYPRPHMERDSFLCLNGWWEFAQDSGECASHYTERIRVPFAPQSALSGIGREIPPQARLCYKREFSLPHDFVCERVLLHVDAADREAQVLLNGNLLGAHKGGYERFSFDVTDVLSERNVLEIFVSDSGDTAYPYGKQRKKRGGMWYTPVSGIWQSVWLESVPRAYISELQVKTDRTGADIHVLGTSLDGTVTLHTPQGDREFALCNGHARVSVEEPVYWSPACPHLYRFTVRAGEDTVRSYFALRTLEILEIGGKKRLCLNGKPFFFHGLLDQGYFSDGIFTPASPQEYERDILLAKRLGFNMLRKHIKVEAERFYYDCDRLGMVVFQDMVNNGDYSFLRDTALPTLGFKRRNDKRMHRDVQTRRNFIACMESTVKRLQFHPSVCYWTIFNEGWGQFDHADAYARLKSIDASRFVDSASGWFYPPKRGEFCSDVESPHVYFKPIRLQMGEKPLVLSEFGGYSYRVAGHVFNLSKNYGYRTFGDAELFGNALEELYLQQVLPAVRAGLSGAVYTQLCDVEDETNGLMTYDRRVVKVSEERMQRIAAALLAEGEKI